MGRKWDESRDVLENRLHVTHCSCLEVNHGSVMGSDVTRRCFGFILPSEIYRMDLEENRHMMQVFPSRL